VKEDVKGTGKDVKMLRIGNIYQKTAYQTDMKPEKHLGSGYLRRFLYACCSDCLGYQESPWWSTKRALIQTYFKPFLEKENHHEKENP
jgi:hypothetical protein